MSKPRVSIGISAALATAVVLTGCAAGGDPEPVGGDFTGEYDGPAVTLSYWNGFTGGDGPFMQEMVDRFNDEHENITVESNTMQWADFYQRLPAAVTAGEGPDVGVMHFDQLGSNAARQVILPLDDMVDDLGLDASDFTETVWEAGVYNEQRYGIPLDIHSLAMYYNTEHFEAAGITEVPTDAASFEAALDALQEAGYDTPFWMPARWPGHLMFLTLNWQFGGESYAADGSAATFAEQPGVEALTWMRSMVDEGYSPADVAQDAQYVAFKNGETSITWDGIWQFNDLEASDVPYAGAPIPNIGGQDATWASSHQFFLPRQTDENRLNAAKVFIAWMSEHSEDWAGAAMIPARQSVLAGGALEGMPQEPIAADLDNMRFIPTTPGIGTVQSETLEVAVADGVLGAGTPAAVLEEAQGRATQLMEENLATFGE